MDFTEKYKPKTLEEYHCDDELKARIRTYIDTGSRKPLIFYGPPGNGKTTIAQVICNELGAHMYDVNASIHNGVDKIRDDVVTWARNTVIGSNGLKVIFFDEADRLTPQAQDALKRIIDDHSKNTIFIFCTNNIHKIIKALKSRANTTTFEMGYVSDGVIEALLVDVVGQIEGCKDVDVAAIVKLAHGEPRHAINLLQSYIDGCFTVPEDVRSKFVKFMALIPVTDNPLDLLHYIREDDLDGMSKYLLEHLGIEPIYCKDSLKIIADTDRALQHSINKDVHLLNMIIRLSEL